MTFSKFKIFRITVLVLILLSVWNTAIRQKHLIQDWDGTLSVMIMPIAADENPQTRSYIQQLSTEDYEGIIDFFNREGQRYNSDLKHKIVISVDTSIQSLPPQIPPTNSSRLAIIIWSLKLRWWAFNNKPDNYHNNQIQLYTLYSRPHKNQLLPHSTGLEKGLIGIIHARAFNNQNKQNNIVIAHEMMHIFSAADKYNLTSGNVLFPSGYAEPEKTPRYPQRMAEIMAIRIPINKNRFILPRSLKDMRVGDVTAKEIGWIQ